MQILLVGSTFFPAGLAGSEKVLKQSSAELAGLVIFGYLVGSIPIGWLVVWVTGRFDIRGVGTGNVGTANIYRNLGAWPAALVGPAQFAQGLLPVLVARWLGAPLQVQALAGLSALLGNGWPVWLGFNGGRGIAVATGAVAGLDLPLLIALLACFAAGLAIRRIAVGVLAGFVLLPLIDAALTARALALPLAVMAVLILLRRLEGIFEDVRRYGTPLELAYRRLVFDERPGRSLVGRRTDLTSSR
jgi:glycerol-3-phosphate acyltransferase PlsY